MISLKLADIFTNLAEIKKADKSNKEAVLSLMKAARTLRDDPGTLEEILRGKNPGTMDGVDQYCYGLVTEYLENGSIGEYEKFSTDYSEDLIRFIRVTGLGRKRLFAIYEAFNIRDIDDLLDVFMNGKETDILDSSGLGKDVLNPLFSERIKLSLEYFTGISGRNPRWPSQFYADIMIDALRKTGGIKRVEYTGSARRKKSLIGDIDLLVLPDFNMNKYDIERSKRLLEKIAGLPFIRELKSIKRTKHDISARYGTVYEIDLEIIIAGSGSWTWQIFNTTGSKKHILEMEAFTREHRGMKLNSLSGREFHSENELYDRLGLQYIPPELREGRDEIMLASRNRLPDLVDMDDIKGDLHIHSEWSDGLIKYSDIITTAKKLKYEYIAISDHSISNYYGNGLDTGRLIKKMDFIRELKKKYRDINILMGAEVDIKKPDSFDYSAEIIKRLDIALASLHSSFTNSREENTSRAVSALKQDYFDLMAHPSGIVFGNRAPVFIDMDRIIETAAENGKALEINSYYMRLDLDEDNARKAAEAGAKLAINSDSHRPGNMEMVRLGVDVARRAGLESGDVLNTMTVSQLKKWRQNRRR